MTLQPASYERGKNPGLDQFANMLMREILIRMFVGMPGTVIAWTPPNKAESEPAFVQVRPDFKFSYILDREVKTEEMPIIPNVPVHYPGMAGIYMRGPIDPGETGWIKFAQRSIDVWINKGGPIDPVDPRILDINDAIFEPGLRHGVNAQDVSPGHYVLGAEDGSWKLEVDKAAKNITLTTSGPSIRIESAAEVTVEAPIVKLGANATLGNARLNDPVSANAELMAFIGQVTGIFNKLPPGPVVSGPGLVTPPGPIIGTISTASTKVLSE